MQQNMPYDIENQEAVALTKTMASEWRKLPPLTSDCCIYRVSERLRQVNVKAYSPQMVSIGPLHHGIESLRTMEEHKTRFLRDYVERTNMSLDHCVEIVWNNEAKLRSSYAEPLRFSRGELVRIVLVDAVFLIEVLLRNSFPEFQENHDRIFTKPWLIQDIGPDLLLLENQIPLFIIEALFFPTNIQFPSDSDPVSILKLVHNFFKDPMHLKGIVENWENESTSDSKPVEHFVDFLRSLHIPNETRPQENLTTLSIPSVTELHKAGVKFKAARSINMFDISFSSGVLTIPKLTISGEMEQTIRNLLAFEQCHFEKDNYLNDYAIMMVRLINTGRDIDLLVRYKIVENMLCDSSEAAALMNKLGEGAIIDSDGFYFASISVQLNAYSKASWNKWWTNLRQNYFNTPWSIASVVVAVLLIALTILQATINVISYINKKHSSVGH